MDRQSYISDEKSSLD